MTAEELYRSFSDSNIFVVPVLMNTNLNDREGYFFDGNLSEFISTLSNLEIKTVFLTTKYFTENEFSGEIDIEYDDWTDTVPIAEVFPEIDNYKEKIGQPTEFNIIAKGINFELNFQLIESWWEEILIESSRKCREIEDQESLKSEEVDKKFKQKKTKVYKRIKALLSDQNFIKLPTQRSMFAYAEENIEDVSVLEESELKQEVQKLNDILVARGQR